MGVLYFIYFMLSVAFFCLVLSGFIFRFKGFLGFWFFGSVFFVRGNFEY